MSPMSAGPRVWVVEMWHPHRKRWEPTVGCGLNTGLPRG